MKKWMIIPVIILLTLVGVGLYTSQTAQQAPEQQIVVKTPDIPPTPQELLERVNIERTKVGAKPLVLDSRLNVSAQYKSDDMSTRGYFDHKDPETGVKNGVEQIKVQMTGQCAYVGENLVTANTTDPLNYAVMAWVNSESHYAAMVDERYELTGFGVSMGQYAYNITQHFCDLK